MKEKIAIWIAWHLPRELVKWAAIRLWAHATQDGRWWDEGEHPTGDDPSLPFGDCLKAW